MKPHTILFVVTSLMFIAGCKTPAPQPDASGPCLKTTIALKQHDATTDRLIGSVDGTISVANTGSAPAANVNLTVLFSPSNITMTAIPNSLTPAGAWTSSTAPFMATLGTIPPGSVRTVKFSAKSDALSTFNLVVDAKVDSTTALTQECNGRAKANVPIVVIF
jgi:hypothetical protein